MSELGRLPKVAVGAGVGSRVGNAIRRRVSSCRPARSIAGRERQLEQERARGGTAARRTNAETRCSRSESRVPSSKIARKSSAWREQHRRRQRRRGRENGGGASSLPRARMRRASRGSERAGGSEIAAASSGDERPFGSRARSPPRFASSTPCARHRARHRARPRRRARERRGRGTTTAPRTFQALLAPRDRAVRVARSSTPAESRCAFLRLAAARIFEQRFDELCRRRSRRDSAPRPHERSSHPQARRRAPASDLHVGSARRAIEQASRMSMPEARADPRRARRGRSRRTPSAANSDAGMSSAVLVHECARKSSRRIQRRPPPRIHDLQPSTDAPPSDDEVVSLRSGGARPTTAGRNVRSRVPRRESTGTRLCARPESPSSARRTASRRVDSTLPSTSVWHASRRSSVRGVDAVALEQTLQRGRAAIHRRGLHDLGARAKTAAARIEAVDDRRTVSAPPPDSHRRLFKELADGSEHELGRRGAADADLDACPAIRGSSGSSEVRRRPRNAELDADSSVARFAGDTLDRDFGRSELQPRESRRDAERRRLRLERAPSTAAGVKTPLSTLSTPGETTAPNRSPGAPRGAARAERGDLADHAGRPAAPDLAPFDVVLEPARSRRRRSGASPWLFSSIRPRGWRGPPGRSLARAALLEADPLDRDALRRQR